MKNNFVKCGLVGLCFEIVWTGLGNLINHDKRMMGHSSIIMFPIYGMASLFKPVYRFIKGENIFVRGGIYATLIFMVEYITGIFLKSKKICPWDYTGKKFNIKGVIRLDYAPTWFFVGLMYERILNVKK